MKIKLMVGIKDEIFFHFIPIIGKAFLVCFKMGYEIDSYFLGNVLAPSCVHYYRPQNLG